MDTNATTFATYQYWDLMDGDAMVCSSLGPPDYQLVCNLNEYGLGIVFITEALSLLYNARRMERLESTVLLGNKNLSSQSNNGHEAKLNYRSTKDSRMSLGSNP